MKINELYHKWYADKKQYVKRSTMSAYMLLANNHILPYWGEKNGEDVNNQLMQEFIMHLINKDLSPKTAKDIAIVMKMILDYGSEMYGLTPTRFKLRYPPPTRISSSLEVYTPEEQKKILRYILDVSPTSENIAIAITLCTGMRIGEICALRWGNIDVDKHLINVHTTVQRVYMSGEDLGNKKTKIIFDTPKTSSSYRTVPIAKILVPLLRTYKKVMKDDFFVTSGTPRLIEPRVLRVHYRHLIREDIGLSRCIKFHGLRHSFATRLISTGTDPKTTSHILGHSKVEMTMNLYVHPSDTNKMDAINKSMKSLFK